MKFLIFVIVSAVNVAAISLRNQQLPPKPTWLCEKRCSEERDPYCACKTEAEDDCKEFANKCLFEEFNCVSRNYRFLKKGKCENVEHQIMIAPWCLRGCPYNFPVEGCACRTIKPRTCIITPTCVFEMTNCTTQDFVRVHIDACYWG